MTKSRSFKRKPITLLLIPLVVLFSLAIIAFVVANTYLNKTQSTASKAAYSYASAMKTYGKGVIYYTENYITDYSLSGRSKYDLPLADTITRQKLALSPQMIRGTECSRYYDLTDVEIDGFKKLGLNHVIIGYGPGNWYNVAPTRPSNPTNPNDPAYKFTKLDEWIGKLQANNLKVILLLWGTPTWASGQNGFSANNIPVTSSSNQAQIDVCKRNPYVEYQPYNYAPANLDDYANFVEAVAKRYNGSSIINPITRSSYLKVNDFALWNEPNISGFWNAGNNGDARFVDLHNRAASRIRSFRKDGIIWGGNISGACCRSGAMIDYLVSSSTPALDYDIFSIHSYPTSFYDNPRLVSNPAYYPLNRIPELVAKLDSRPEFRGKPLGVTETGYRSQWERQFAIEDADRLPTENTKAQWVAEGLSMINNYNASGIAKGRIVAVDNNVYYNPWRWWSTGVVNFSYNSSINNFYPQETLAFNAFKDWSLVNSSVPTVNVDAVAVDAQNNYFIFKSERYWQRQKVNGVWTAWKNDSIKNFVYSSPNAASVNVPIQDFDAAYFGSNGFTIIKGDRYWNRTNPTAYWVSNTLKYAWHNVANAAQVGVPTSDVDAVYFDSLTGSAYTIIKGDRYWWRSATTNNWSTNLLQTAYYAPSNSATASVPIRDIDTAYPGLGGYTIIKGDRYWYIAPWVQKDKVWYSNTLTQAFQ